ncbi:MAG: LamB/YcsF family protein [Actinomycetales bacterium]|nr:MAG: LamB/YcsF family protein [Actinomycetales bacterium]
MDLNSDVGESFGRWTLGDDAAVLDVVTSANVACGFHAGDPSTIRSTCRLAVARDVSIGAQVSYRDLAGFGRRFVDASRRELTDDVAYQIGALQALAAAEDGLVTYVKPHGALYNTAVHHGEHAQAVVDAVRDVDPSLAVLGLPGSELLRRAEQAGLRPVTEGFADRAYRPDGTLVPRSEAGAVLTDPAHVADQAERLAATVDSVCVHGDTPDAVSLALAVRHRLTSRGVDLRAFS